MLMYLLVGLLGVVIQVLVKMNSVKSLFDVANQPFNYSRFFDREMVAICTSIAFVLLMATTVNEWLSIRPGLENYIRLIFALGGAIGSWAAGYTLGKSKSFIKNIIDKKTNIADGIDPK